jgi:hypothetical protein
MSCRPTICINHPELGADSVISLLSFCSKKITVPMHPQMAAATNNPEIGMYSDRPVLINGAIEPRIPK